MKRKCIECGSGNGLPQKKIKTLPEREETELRKPKFSWT